ncbi:MAG: hypothetical protein LBS50_02115 [Prevotellaceae bacterium]|nr:hypothetical protein [Prevotellaceae bacterium]
MKACIENDSSETILATALYNNGVLNFELPATLARSKLIPMLAEFSDWGQ